MKRFLVLLLCISMLIASTVVPTAAVDKDYDSSDTAVSDDPDAVDGYIEAEASRKAMEEGLKVSRKTDSDRELAETGWKLLTEEQFQTKMGEMRVKYPDGDIWEGVYYEYGSPKAWECWAYASQMMYEFFGMMFYADGYSSYKLYNSDDLCAGDWVRIDLWGGSSEGTHSIFITKVTDSGVYFTDGNGTGVYNQIRWDGYYTWSQFNSMFRWRVHLPGNTLKGSAPADWRYTISYDSNGGSGSMSSETIKANSGFKLKDNEFTRSGYIFGGYKVRRSIDKKWYTTDAGWQYIDDIEDNGYTYKIYPQGNSYTLGTPWIGDIYGSCTFTFYAVWIPSYTVGYNSNGGSGSMEPDIITANSGFTLKNNGFTRSGYSFGGYTVRRSYDDKWYTVDAGWQTLSDIYDNAYTFKVYPEQGSYNMGAPWLGSITEACSFTFYADWIPDKSAVEFFDNYSGYNYLLGSDFGFDYDDYIYSRDNSVYSVSIDSKERLNNSNSLKITGKSAGSSGKDLAIVTSTNNGYGSGYSQQCTVGDDKEFCLRFYAKASVSGAKMYIRWGHSGVYQTVTLTTSWEKYTVTIPKNRFCGAVLHPYFDKKGTYYINSVALGEKGTTNVVGESGRRSFTTRYIDLGGKAESLPEPYRNGYEFLGWYTAAEGGRRITTDTPISESAICLYAHWSKKESMTPVSVVRANGHIYELYDNEMGWEDAESFCEKLGGHLITIESSFENSLAYDMIKDRQGYCWIGLKYDTSTKQWNWVNGAWPLFNYWYSPKYGIEDTGEHYAMMYPMNVGTTAYASRWDKCVGSDSYRSYYNYHNSFFICEYDDLIYLGDADGSGIVDIMDATVVQNSVVGVNVPFLANKLIRGDIDNSGELEVFDATFIQRYVAEIATPFAIGALID